MRARSAVIALMLVAAAAIAATVGSVDLPDTVSITGEGPQLLLNGAGERKILLFKIYAIGLYLPVRAKTMQDVINIKGPKRMHMVVLRDITAQQVHDHVLARIEDGSQPSEMALMKARMEDLDRIIMAEKSLPTGGSIILDFVPGKGTIIRVNGVAKGEPLPGEDFYNALLRIWLGDKAKSLPLRDQLLGRGASAPAH